MTDKTLNRLEGSVLGHPSNWRKARLIRKFTDSELKEFCVSKTEEAGSLPTSNASRGTYTSGWNDPETMAKDIQPRGLPKTSEAGSLQSCRTSHLH